MLTKKDFENIFERMRKDFLYDKDTAKIEQEVDLHTLELCEKIKNTPNYFKNDEEWQDFFKKHEKDTDLLCFLTTLDNIPLECAENILEVMYDDYMDHKISNSKSRSFAGIEARNRDVIKNLIHLDLSDEAIDYIIGLQSLFDTVIMFSETNPRNSGANDYSVAFNIPDYTKKVITNALIEDMKQTESENRKNKINVFAPSYSSPVQFIKDLKYLNDLLDSDLSVAIKSSIATSILCSKVLDFNSQDELELFEKAIDYCEPKFVSVNPMNAKFLSETMYPIYIYHLDNDIVAGSKYEDFNIASEKLKEIINAKLLNSGMEIDLANRFVNVQAEIRHAPLLKDLFINTEDPDVMELILRLPKESRHEILLYKPNTSKEVLHRMTDDYCQKINNYYNNTSTAFNFASCKYDNMPKLWTDFLNVAINSMELTKDQYDIILENANRLNNTLFVLAISKFTPDYVLEKIDDIYKSTEEAVQEKNVKTIYDKKFWSTAKLLIEVNKILKQPEFNIEVSQGQLEKILDQFLIDETDYKNAFQLREGFETRVGLYNFIVNETFDKIISNKYSFEACLSIPSENVDALNQSIKISELDIKEFLSYFNDCFNQPNMSKEISDMANMLSSALNYDNEKGIFDQELRFTAEKICGVQNKILEINSFMPHKRYTDIPNLLYEINGLLSEYEEKRKVFEDHLQNKLVEAFKKQFEDELVHE